MIRALGRKVWDDAGWPPPAQVPTRVLRWVRRTLLARLYPPFGEADFHAGLDRVGIGPGATLFVHSSWDEFYNFQGKPLNLIEALVSRIGVAGTLAMPAYAHRIDPDEVFDVRRMPTGAGLVAELFRRMRGVSCSINLFHSVAALGPGAEFLTRDHHRSVTSWDRFSP